LSGNEGITDLLLAWGEGDPDALDRLMPLVYADLRRIARAHLAHEPAGNSLQATGLVNEAYLRLVNQNRVQWQNRAHFFALAARLMRRIVVDHARARRAQKRGGGAGALPLEGVADPHAARDARLLDLDTALDRLAEQDPRASQIVELRHFGGLSIEEAAETLDLSPATVKREWSVARAWLQRELATP